MHFIPIARRHAVAAIAAVAIVIVLGFGARAFVDVIGRLGAEVENAALLSVTSSAAAALDPAAVESLSGNAADAATPALEDLRRRLKRVRAALPGTRFVYLMGVRNRKIVFLADAEPRHSPDYSPPGEVYYEDTAIIWKVLKTGMPAIDGPATDRWGTWVSGLAPVVDPVGGRTVAVFGIDVPAPAWQREVARYRLFAMAIAGLVGVLVAVFAAALLFQARARARIARLNGELGAKLEALELSNRIVENSSTIVFRMDLGQGCPLTYVSRNIDHYGYAAHDLLSRPQGWHMLFHQDDRADIDADIARLAEGSADRTRRELRLRRRDGSWAWIDGRLSVVRDTAGRRIALEGMLFDITERKRADEQIAHLATHDALTGLVNRPAFVERLQMAFAETRRNHVPFAVHYLDIDHFKDINDAFGHEKGDQLLKAVAGRMSQSLRASDMVGRFSIARFGGDEFAVLQTGVGEASDAAALAQRLIRLLSNPFDVGGNEIHITVSMGISLYEPAIAEPNDMLMQADLALYRAKDGGRNQYHFHSANLDTEVRERVAIAEDLHGAIENDQLELHYQPQVEIPSGRIVGAEALLRWNHPRRGMVWPDRFIAVAEKTGMINMLGEWVIRRACRQIREWRAEGLAPPIVGVNVSAVQFHRPEQLLAVVRDAMHASGIESPALELELTETVLAEAATSHSDILERLTRLGLRIAVDDFGTGYSSLQYLHAFPIGRIKIAQQFMSGAGGDAAIVRAVIELGRALGLDVVAEGVETEAQTEFLRNAGCHTVQGYYFSPPVNAAAMAALLRQGAFAYPRKTRKTAAA